MLVPVLDVNMWGLEVLKLWLEGKSDEVHA